MSEITGRELGWTEAIEKHGPEFISLPDGDYDFEVINFERGRHAGSDKLPPCNKATVHIKFEVPEGITIIKHNLFLHSITEGVLCEFFNGIGQRQKGERITMDWNSVVGAKGRAKVGTRKWKGEDGEERFSNQIIKFYEKETKSFEPGRF